MCLSFINRCKFFCIYRCKTFKVISLLSLAMTLICLLSISESFGSDTLYSTIPVSAIFGTSSTINTNNNFLTYQDNTLGIKIDYPAGWIRELHAGGLITFLPSLEGNSNTYPAGLGITVEHLKSKNMPLTDITKTQIKNLTENHSDFRLVESTEFRLAGNIANKIVFTATDSMKHERKAMQIWTLKGDKAYLITYKAEPGQYSKYLPTIQRMIDSFQFIK
jgi:eukaryotic-like serine/threonine-protein kinase